VILFRIVLNFEDFYLFLKAIQYLLLTLWAYHSFAWTGRDLQAGEMKFP